MLGIERREKIIAKLNLERKVYVSELSKLFNVTEETIRRDLERENLIRRSYGGAILNERTSEDLSFVKRSMLNAASKNAIAEKAVNLISEGDTIAMDSSTTCLAFLRGLLDKKNLTIITNSVRLTYDFANSPFKIISTGGNLRAHSYALTGNITCAALQKYYVDFAVLSCKGIDLDRGVMESNEEESIVKQAMIAQAKKTILLVDHSKFDKIAFTKTCDFNKISVLVTDAAPNLIWQNCFAENSVELIF